MVCPNYNSPEWKMASSLLGENKAYSLFITNNNNLPNLGTIKKMALSKALMQTYLNSSQLMGIGDVNSFFNFINEKYKDKEIMFVFRPEKVKDEPYAQGTTYFGSFEQAVKYSDNSKINTFAFSIQDNKFISLDFQQDTDNIDTLRGYESRYIINDVGDNSISLITTQDPTYQEGTDSIFVVTKGKPEIDNLNSESLVEEFNKFVTPTTQVFVTDQSTKIKPEVSELFESNPDLASIGTQEQYSQYLDSIFPDSKVKDIVYHGSIYKNKQRFKKSTRVSGYYFATTPQEALQHAQRQLTKPEDANLYRILLNIKNPRILSKAIDYEDLDTEVSFTIGDELFYDGADGIIAEKVEEYNTTYKTPESTWIEKQIIAFEPEQIHILGNQEDIEGFKKFVNSSSIKQEPSELSEEDLTYGIRLPSGETMSLSYDQLTAENLKQYFPELTAQQADIVAKNFRKELRDNNPGYDFETKC